VSDLERSLNEVLEEHRHESGLHMIGGQRRLLTRLVEFVEAELKEKELDTKSDREH
jgi:hypothetical protein